MAEFKARGLGDEEMADRIRDKMISHKKLMAYIEDESHEVFLKLPIVKNEDKEPNASQGELSYLDSGNESPMSP